MKLMILAFLARLVMIVLACALTLWAVYTLGEIHRHLHVIECALTGSITDVDGTRWEEGSCDP